MVGAFRILLINAMIPNEFPFSKPLHARLGQKEIAKARLSDSDLVNYILQLLVPSPRVMKGAKKTNQDVTRLWLYLEGGQYSDIVKVIR